MRPRSPDPRDVSLERPPRDLDALQLLVAERKIRGAQGVVVAVHDELAVEALGGRDRGLIDARDVAAGEPQISAIAAGGAQLTDALAMRGAALLFENVSPRCKIVGHQSHQRTDRNADHRMIGAITTHLDQAGVNAQIDYGP